MCDMNIQVHEGGRELILYIKFLYYTTILNDVIFDDVSAAILNPP